MNELTMDQALNNLEAVCANFNGNLQQHMALQKSLEKIKSYLAQNNAMEKVEEKSN